MDLKELGRRLKKLREEKFGKGQSYAKFQAVSGVSRGSVGNIEAGLQEPGVDTLDKWLRACGTTIAEFFGAPSKGDFSLPFEFDPDHAEEHEMLAIILSSGDGGLLQGIRVNLEAISKMAQSMKPGKAHPSRASPKGQRRVSSR